MLFFQQLQQDSVQQQAHLHRPQLQQGHLQSQDGLQEEEDCSGADLVLEANAANGWFYEHQWLTAASGVICYFLLSRKASIVCRYDRHCHIPVDP